MKGQRDYIVSLLLLVAALLTTSCLGNIEPPQGKGWLRIGKPSMETADATRASTDKEIDYLVSIYRNGVLAMNPVRYSTIAGRISLSAGTSYSLLAESCTMTEAESLPTTYGQPRYAGTSLFSIEANTGTTVYVKCSMANAAFMVVKDASFYYPEFEVTATVGGRSLSFTNEEQMGYFNVGADSTATLHYSVVAVDAEGRIGRGEGEIALRSRNLSKLNLKATSVGYVDVSVSYDDTFTPIVSDIIINE